MNDKVYGFIAVIIAVLLFGSQGVPIKRAKTGDGFFFQWVTTVGIWMIGLIVYQFKDNPHFEPAAMLGGAFWATGNVMVIPIVKLIGFSMGIMIWGVTNLFVGWLVGYVGLFGLKAQSEHVERPYMNILGAIISSLSVVIFAFIRPDVSSKPKVNETLEEGLISNNHVQRDAEEEDDDGFPIFKKMSDLQKKALGIFLSVLSGVVYGVNFDPIQYMIDHGNSLDQQIDYIFAHFCGILLAGTCYLIIYCFVKKNKPQVYPGSILPGLIAGWIWAVAQTFFSVANTKLDMIASFPLISTGPGIVGALWGVFVFKEIKGTRNYIFLVCAICVNIVGVVLIVMAGRND
eukprot:TRINITY_DN8362_c0_g1_i1.p1 TRINITY_DN8362_c0_g1~~TRINITY_DN8362_c0_g1_i1.p1  ORF type:complete len:345 (-),score=77.95 TRINITY_DN8362_c0_g1_i1:526-1560(-)